MQIFIRLTRCVLFRTSWLSLLSQIIEFMDWIHLPNHYQYMCFHCPVTPFFTAYIYLLANRLVVSTTLSHTVKLFGRINHKIICSHNTTNTRLPRRGCTKVVRNTPSHSPIQIALFWSIRFKPRNNRILKCWNFELVLSFTLVLQHAHTHTHALP